MRGETQNVYVKKFNQLKEVLSSKKKNVASKFASNGSLLSKDQQQNGLRNGSSEAELQNKIGGEHQKIHQSVLAIDCSQDEPRPYSHLSKGRSFKGQACCYCATGLAGGLERPLPRYVLTMCLPFLV